MQGARGTYQSYIKEFHVSPVYLQSCVELQLVWPEQMQPRRVGSKPFRVAHATGRVTREPRHSSLEFSVDIGRFRLTPVTTYTY